MANMQATDGREAGDSSFSIRLTSSSLGAFLEISPDAFVLVNQSGIIVAVNQKAEALFGSSCAQLLEKPLEQLFPERFLDGHREDLVRYFSTPHPRPIGAGFSLIGLRQDGTEFPVDITLKSLLLDERLVVLAAVRDMSTQRHLEKELVKLSSELERAHQAAHQLASIVNSSGDAILSKTLEGVITSWNSCAEHLYGYAADEVLGQSVSLIIPPDRQEELPNILERIKVGAATQHYETVRMRKDGTLVEVSITVSPIRDVEGRIVGASTIAHDITEHKLMERELARRRDEREQIMQKLEAMNQQLYGLFEHAPAGLVLFDACPPYQVLLHNIFYQEFFPEPFYSEGMLGKYLPEYVPRLEEDGVSEVFRQVVSTRQSKTMFHFVYDGMPQGRTWWNWHLAPIIQGGEVTAITMMVIETTREELAGQRMEIELAERKNAEDALRQSRDELVAVNVTLEEANQVRSQFLATMPHELRTPLASITGYSEMLLEDAQASGWSLQHQNSLERILTNSEHLLDLINDVLDLSKLEAGRMVLDSRQVDPRALLRDVAAEIGSLAIKRTLFLKTEVEEGLDYLETNPGKLRQILLNLVSNALKFTEHGGVTLSAKRARLSEEGAEGIAFAVQDSGIGIPPELQERVFEAFYQADMSYTRRVGGTGLGLSIVRQLTALLGGTITVASVPGQGSTFTVILPVKTPHGFIGQELPRLHPGQPEDTFTAPPVVGEPMPAPSLDARDRSGEAAAGPHNLILVVDDNPDAIALIKDALRDTPYTVIGVQDPLQVMALVQELHPYAITLDVMMPNLNGWQLLHQLKDNPATASIPVIMLTVLSEHATGYVLGADHYLIKPFKKEMLRHTLEHLLEAKQSPLAASTCETQPVTKAD